MPYADVNGLHLYYEEQGSGPPLVLLNGGMGTLDRGARGGWDTLRPLLAQRFRVVHVEARGHGRTDDPGGPDAHTLPTLAADIAALVAHLGLGPAHVAGFSLGALVGLELALAHPHVLRSVVGIGGFYTADAKTRAGLQDPDRIEQTNPAWAAEMAWDHDQHHQPGYWKDLSRWIIAASIGARSYAVEDLGRIAVPTLWIAGENDPFFELDQILTMKRRIPGAEILIVNRAGHFPQLAHPYLVGPVVADFLARADQQRQ
jgi:pimeloyl-ACP methyl ester carboxylesterase